MLDVPLNVQRIGVGLTIAVLAPWFVRLQYSVVRAQWPQAKWVARLLLAALEGLALMTIDMAFPDWPIVCFLIITGVTFVAVITWAVVLFAQIVQYGPPPQTPPA
jgi:hypothetical protein